MEKELNDFMANLRAWIETNAPGWAPLQDGSLSLQQTGAGTLMRIVYDFNISTVDMTSYRPTPESTELTQNLRIVE